jgi:photosystem II stability/assembly factor-like uncharacterized protein
MLVLAPGAGAAEPAGERSEVEPLAIHSLLLGVARAGEKRLVAVGERGHVLISDDGGRAWRQVVVPTRATLTAVYFQDALHGVAVGHDEVILASVDGGASWALAHASPEAQQPLLAVWFRDARNGIAVGAYSSVFATHDGGASWKAENFAPRPLAGPKTGKHAVTDMREDEGVSQPHLYAIAPGAGVRLFLAGEAGHLYRSDDSGASWAELASPYAGSFFGMLALPDNALLLYGLRGHLYLSEDGGARFRALATDTVAQIAGGAQGPDGSVVLVGLSGVVLYSRDGRTFRLHQEADRKAFSAVAFADDAVVLVGEDGVRRLPRATLERE